MSIVGDNWWDLPRSAQGIKLYELREELRAKNLYDTEEPPLEKVAEPAPGNAPNYRTSDGTYNDISCPRMGSAGIRFGRNVPLSEAFPDTADLMNPSPRRVSLELLTRTTFQPATILNVIAAAWIQFMVHDWFVHTKSGFDNAHEVPLTDADPWFERPMKVLKSVPDALGPGETGKPPAYVNENSHWWDASQIYGTALPVATAIRTGVDGKVISGTEGRLPLDPQGQRTFRGVGDDREPFARAVVEQQDGIARRLRSDALAAQSRKGWRRCRTERQDERNGRRGRRARHGVVWCGGRASPSWGRSPRSSPPRRRHSRPPGRSPWRTRSRWRKAPTRRSSPRRTTRPPPTGRCASRTRSSFRA